MELAARAVSSALADAGLDRNQIDGVIVHPAVSETAFVDELVWSLGLEVRYATQVWGHGWWVGSLVSEALGALSLGHADRIAIVYSSSDSSTNIGFRTGVGLPPRQLIEEGFRDFGGASGEMNHIGAASPVAMAALAAQRYFHLYGCEPDDLAEIAVASRYNASLNPNAAHRTVITRDDYLASPWIVEPMRAFDCCRISDGAACVILGLDEGDRTVDILASSGLQLGADQYTFGHSGLGGWWEPARDGAVQARADDDLYRRAGVARGDIDGVYTYDAFTILIPLALEKYGFHEYGEGLRALQSGAMRVGGELPVNTHGGLHSEGHSSGWGAFAEMVRQLRGEAGDRQIADAEVLQWAPLFGNSVILGRN